MKRKDLCRLLGIGLLGAAAGCGQTQGQRYAVAPTQPRGVAMVYANGEMPMTRRPIAPAYVSPASHQESPVVEGQVVTADHQVAAGSVQPEVIPVAASEPAVPAPAVVAAPAAAPPAPPAPAGPSDWAPVVEHVVPARSNLVGEPPPSRRAVHDITASPCFAKADDYSWLQGQVEYSRLSKSWRLRYASVDEVDRYGGSVTLTGDRFLDSLKDGQHIRVRGYLPNPESRSIAPTYHVEAIEPIEHRGQ